MSAALEGGGEASRVPQAAPLIEFAEAVLRGDETRRNSARAALYRALGAAALVDAAAVVASFNAVVKIADGSGIPLEESKAAATEDLRAALKLEQFNNNVAAD
jgi:hypothetical protein